MLDVIHKKVCIKVDEDVFFVTVVEESVDVADKMGGFKLVRGGYDNTTSPPSFSINVKQVMIAATDREDRDNDESESVNVRIAELAQEVMGTINGGGKLKKHNVGRGQRVQGREVYSKECTNPAFLRPKGIQFMGSSIKAQEQVFGSTEDFRGLGNRHVETKRLDDF
ncbi:hypothetical protein Ancab_011344 [Ancistrocladus abbreviatus]